MLGKVQVAVENEDERFHFMPEQLLGGSIIEKGKLILTMLVAGEISGDGLRILTTPKCSGRTNSLSLCH